MQTIPIFFTFNNSYVMPAAVAFYSLLQKAKEGIFYEMHVLHSDITEKNKKILLDVVSRFNNANLTFENTKNFLKDNWNNGNFDGHNVRTQFTVDTIVRCFGARFFPQYDKIIYSDVDCVFVEDISDLWKIDLTDKYMAGVKGAFMKFDKNELSHLKPEHYEMLKDSYIAGGIWVMNLNQIRKDNLEDRMLEIINDDTIIKRWNDQDIVNIACKNKVAFIPLNYIAYPYLRERIRSDNFVSDYSRDELYDSLISPKIIHYAGIKPWNNNPHYSEIWWNIFDYLKLPKSSIFIEKKDKVKKYRKLFQKAIILATLFLTLNIIMLVLLIIK